MGNIESAESQLQLLKDMSKFGMEILGLGTAYAEVTIESIPK